MPIFENAAGRVILFIHIPKTGGTSIESWLSQQCDISFYSTIIPNFMKCSPQHMCYDDFELLFPNPIKQAFSIVRDPYDKLESEYFFRTRNLQKELKPKFNPWIRLHLSKIKINPFHFDNHFRPQTQFLSDEVKVFKYEDGFDEIINYLTSSLDLKQNIEFPVKNKGDRYPVSWNANTILLVNEIFKDDFELLGYKPRTVNLDVQ